MSHFGRQRLVSRRRLRFAGSSRDKGCRGANNIVSAGKVRSVFVSVARVRGKPKRQTCSFLTKQGTLTPFRSCRKPVLLRAKGTSRWRITLTARGLPPGNYRVVVRGVDASKNKERPTKGRNIAPFVVR